MNWALLKTKWKNIYVMLIFLGMAFSVSAQNNPQKINDKLYPLYIKAYNMRKQAASQPLADSLRQAAIAIGDRYGECFALQVKFLYEYYKPNNFRHFDQSLQAYMDKVLSYGMDRFYFYAVSMKTFYYTREKRYLEGFLYLQEQTNIAESRNNHYGICMLHRVLYSILVANYGRTKITHRQQWRFTNCIKAMSNKMRHKLTTLFVAIIIFIATTFPVAAHIQHAISCVASNNSVHTPKHIYSLDTIPNYVIPYNVPLVDKAPVTAVDAKLSQLLVPVKHYCFHSHDLATVDRALKPYMLYAKEHNRIEHFYTGVSLRTTFLVNSSANYAAAIDYQTKMLDYAKKHNHLYGIIIGLVSLGNMHRSCFQLVQAIDAYKQALELNKKYPSRFHDIGIDYKRIAECYFIAINFEKTLEMANLGLALSKSEVSIGGLQCIKALALFMLDLDAEFIKAYNAYKSHTNVALGVLPHMANCVEVMKKIYDADYAAVNKMLTHENIGGYITYIDVAYNKRIKNYPRVLDAMRRYNLLAYGESNGAFAPGFMQMGSAVTNNLAELDRRRAANENSRLELTRINLELKRPNSSFISLATRSS